MSRILALGLLTLVLFVGTVESLQLPTSSGQHFSAPSINNFTPQRSQFRPNIRNFRCAPEQTLQVLRGGSAAPLGPLDISILLTILPGMLLSLAPRWSMVNAFQCTEGLDKINEQFTRAIGLSELSTAIFAYLVYKEGRLGAGMLVGLTIALAEITMWKQSKEGGLVVPDSICNTAYGLTFTLIALTLAGEVKLANVCGSVLTLVTYLPCVVFPKQGAKMTQSSDLPPSSTALFRLYSFSLLTKPLLGLGVVTGHKKLGFLLGSASYIARVGVHMIKGVQSLGQPRMAILPSWIIEVVMTMWLAQTDF